MTLLLTSLLTSPFQAVSLSLIGRKGLFGWSSGSRSATQQLSVDCLARDPRIDAFLLLISRDTRRLEAVLKTRTAEEPVLLTQSFLRTTGTDTRRDLLSLTVSADGLGNGPLWDVEICRNTGMQEFWPARHMLITFQAFPSGILRGIVYQRQRKSQKQATSNTQHQQQCNKREHCSTLLNLVMVVLFKAHFIKQGARMDWRDDGVQDMSIHVWLLSINTRLAGYMHKVLATETLFVLQIFHHFERRCIIAKH